MKKLMIVIFLFFAALIIAFSLDNENIRIRQEQDRVSRLTQEEKQATATATIKNAHAKATATIVAKIKEKENNAEWDKALNTCYTEDDFLLAFGIPGKAVTGTNVTIYSYESIYGTRKATFRHGCVYGRDLSTTTLEVLSGITCPIAPTDSNNPKDFM